MGTRRLWIALLLAVLQYAHAAPCEECAPLKKAECRVPFGCTPGGNMIESTVDGCKRITCPENEFLSGGLEAYAPVLKCSSKGKYLHIITDEEITEAVCTKNISCIHKSFLRSDCTGLEASGCEEIEGLNLDNSKNITCRPGKTLFHLSGRFESESELFCDQKKGLWANPWREHLTATTNVICADYSPTDVSCMASTPLISDCSANFLAKDCKEIATFPEHGESVCPPGRTIYAFYDNPRETWKHKEWVALRDLRCDTSKGEWAIDNAWLPFRDLHSGSNVVCAEQIDHCGLCIGKIPATAGTYPLTGVTDDDKRCARLHCHDDEYMGSQGAGSNGEMSHHDGRLSGIRCHSSAENEEWRNKIHADYAYGLYWASIGKDVNVGNVKTTCFKKVSCSLSLPLTSDCTGLEAWGCVEVDVTSDYDKYCNDGKSLYVKRAPPRDSYWRGYRYVYCKFDTGKWSATVAQLICADSNPSEPVPTIPVYISCVAANPLISECDLSLPPSPLCEPITTFSDDDRISCTTKTLYLKRGNDDWTQAYGIYCNKSTGQWEEHRRDSETINYYTAGDKLICSTIDPNPGTCARCPDLPLATCNSADGCVVGREIRKGTVTGGLLPCSKLTCHLGDFFLTNPPSSDPVVEITCNNEMKWIANGLAVVDEAVCVKKILCTKRTTPKSDCSGLDDWGCQKVDFTNNDDKVCGGKQIMFYKTAAGSTWEHTTDIVCDEVKGVWTGGKQIDVQSGDQVICANSNPDEPPHVSCKSANPLTSNCDASVNSTASCEVITTFTDDTPISCPSKTLYFKQGDGDWKSTDKVQCDRVTGEWKEGSTLQNQLNAGDKVICATVDPNLDPCVRCPDLSLASCSSADGCVAGSDIIKGTATGDRPCKKLTCSRRQYFKTNLAESEVVEQITCNNEKKWITKLEDGRELDITEAVCIKKYSCRKKNPLKSVCDSHLSAYGCQQVDFFNDDDKTCDGALSLFFKSATGTSWEPAEELVCDEGRGVWTRGENLDMQAGDEVICADSNPAEPPRVSCKSTNPITSICDSSVLSTASCEIITTFTDDTPISCPSKTLYFKQGTGVWKSTDKVQCDRLTGKWNEGSAMQNQLTAGDKVICAALDPNPDPCELCPDMPLASCDSIAGCVLGRDVIKGTVAGTTCKKLTCSRREFFTTNLASSEHIDEITCNSEKKWSTQLEDGQSVLVDNAVCIKKFSCRKKSPLISNCAGLEGSGCAEIDLTNNDDDKVCGGKTLFFKTASATTWTDDEALSCDEVTGGWKLSKEKVEMHEGDHVICADSNPEPPLETSDKVRRYMENGRFSKTQ